MDTSSKELNDNSTHLVVILDLSPDSQILKKDVSKQTTSYSSLLNSVISFCNSHLMLNNSNQLTVIVSGLKKNEIVYPTKKNLNVSNNLQGQYELFQKVTNEVISKIKETTIETKKALEKIENSAVKQLNSLLAGAVAIGLCRIQSLVKTTSDSRICIITSCKETPGFYASQYMNFMNTFFSAQKMSVAIDVCVVDDSNDIPSNSILQQGSDLTSGFYLKINNVSSALEYLLWVFLPSIEIRKKMILPTKTKISYKASCFCHRNQVEIGYVCSVCLSIFCQFNPICSTCQTVFKLGPEPDNIKVKKRKVI